MNLGYVKNDLETALRGVFEFNKMTADKQYNLLTGTIENEINVAHKVYVERAEINRAYDFITTIADQSSYTLDTDIKKIYSVDYIINEYIYQVKKIFKEQKAVAETIGNENTVPSFYDDFTEPTLLKVFPAPDVSGASFQLYVEREVTDLTADTDNLVIPWRCYDDFRDYLINRHLILYGFMTADKVNPLMQLEAVKARFLASADKYRRYKAFDNPDVQEVVDGSM